MEAEYEMQQAKSIFEFKDIVNESFDIS